MGSLGQAEEQQMERKAQLCGSSDPISNAPYGTILSVAFTASFFGYQAGYL